MRSRDSILGLITGSLVLSMVALATGIVRGKVSASFLGADGVGLVSQLTALSVLGTTIALAGISTAATVVIGRAHGRADAEEVRTLTAYVIRRPVLVSIAFCAVVLPFSSPIASALLGSPSHSFKLAVAIASIPFNVFSACVNVVLIATQRAKRSIAANVISLALGTGSTISAVAYFGLPGAVASVLLTSVISTAVVTWRERNWVATVIASGHRPSDASRREFVVLGLASFALALASSVLDSGQRAILIHELGLKQAGLFQAISMASGQGFAALVNGVMLYLSPTLAALVAASSARALPEWRRALDITVSLVAALSLVCIISAPVALRVLFSDEFSDAAPALRWQAGAEVLRASAFVIGAILLPLGARVAWLSIGLGTVGIQAALSWLLIPEIGLEALPTAFAVGFAFNLVVSLGWAYHRGWRINVVSLNLVLVVAVALMLGSWPLGETVRILPLGIATIATALLAWRGFRRRERGYDVVATN